MTISPESRAAMQCTFGPLVVEYDERVLVPRQWTLLQSTWAAELAARSAPGPMLELFAGAGHIGLAAAVLADRDLVQVELDPVAAQYARRNAARAGRTHRVDVRCAAVTDALDANERFAVVIADPPYLPTARVSDWPDDPVLAIDGGADGLKHVRSCLDVLEGHLAPDGFVLLQVAGAHQAEQVNALLEAREGSLHLIDDRAVGEQRAVALLTNRVR